MRRSCAASSFPSARLIASTQSVVSVSTVHAHVLPRVAMSTTRFAAEVATADANARALDAVAEYVAALA